MSSATAGKSPTYGNDNNENEAKVNTSLDTTTLSRAIRNAKVNLRQPVVVSRMISGTSTLKSAKITNRYVTALIAKNSDVVTCHCERTATIIGPTTREPFTTVEFNEIAPARSLGGTRDVSIVDQAGIFKAFPTPTPS